jgi:hypothetical protein
LHAHAAQGDICVVAPHRLTGSRRIHLDGFQATVGHRLEPQVQALGRRQRPIDQCLDTDVAEILHQADPRSWQGGNAGGLPLHHRFYFPIERVDHGPEIHAGRLKYRLPHRHAIHGAR